ncbi:maleylpyruvate isomerase family mycothiol-dependent enzyme [Mycolicibacterium sp. YH-1]|uniref:maleylpyruvate isomerase family mycothiol-dependent enzyme n=1 Tax=Mycolicibacterium sp. YH-1 TaxID=2908837 RepID=UPI001F4BDF91|nr:maleylpyruvate isomerase family mycothiol-dependent enzyme [Mycolicibacterium sp. YH-1]UNB50892.1 maleylpyruvate isomerase family mycothiol-dependent enzyme [Mycolicibacterium sp. YH-1]
MKSADHIVALRRDGDRIAHGAEGRLDCSVPSCPGWSVADLVWHVGVVHMFWRMVASNALAGPEAWTEPDRPESADLLSWFRNGVELTATGLAELAPDARAWTWGQRQDVRFIRRRLAQETTVHCWDLVNAIGCDEPIEQFLAADGVDEFLDEVLPGLSHDLGGPTQTICLRARDSGQTWTVSAGAGSIHVTRGAAQADAAVTASAPDLLLLLWRRHSPSQLQVDGDIAALQRFLARGNF